MFVVALLGVEVFRIELGASTAPEPDHPDLTAVSRHSGDFGFAGKPVRPYWSQTYGDEPHVP